MKIQRKDHVSKKMFLYRYRAQNEHPADLAVVMTPPQTVPRVITELGGPT